MSEPASDDQTPDEQGANAPSRPPAVPAEPPPIRASDTEREQVAEVVRTAVADGRLTMVEGDERLRDAYAAIFRRDLTPITADLQPIDRPADPAPGTDTSMRRPLGRLDRPSSTTSVAVLSGAQKRGEWTPGLTHRVFAFWGGAELSFRDARLDDAGLAIGAIAIMGGITLDLRGVPAGVEVTIQAVAIMGGIDVTVDPDTTVIEDGVRLHGRVRGRLGRAATPGRPPRARDRPRAHGRGVGDPQAAVPRRRRRPVRARALSRYSGTAVPALRPRWRWTSGSPHPRRRDTPCLSAGSAGRPGRRRRRRRAPRSRWRRSPPGPAFSAARPALAVRDPASNVASGPGVTIVSSPESNRTR